MNNSEESIQDSSKTKKEIALNYLEHYVYPIPLFSPALLEKGIQPEWYKEKEDEILEIVRSDPGRDNVIQEEELKRDIKVKACKQPLPNIDVTNFYSKKPTEKDVSEWFSEYPEANIGLLIGRQYNLVIVEVGKKIASVYHQRVGDFLKAPFVETSNGYHYYFNFQSIGHFNDTIEENGINLYEETTHVVAPPSVHTTGHIYRWKGYSPFYDYIVDSDPWLSGFISGLNQIKNELEDENEFVKCLCNI